MPATRIAVLTALNGHDDEALAWLEQSASNHEVDLVFVLRDPALDPLRDSPRFQAIEQRVHGQ